MKRICAFFFLALTLLMCLTAAAEEANLIANGGFETLDASGNPKGWYPTAYRTQEGYSRIAITSEKAHSGQRRTLYLHRCGGAILALSPERLRAGGFDGGHRQRRKSGH